MAKDKLTSSSETVVTDVKSVGNAVEAQMSITMKDKNNKPTFEGASKVVCKEDAVYLDITNLLGPQTQAFGKMEVSLSGDGVVLPNNLKAGQKLADSHNEIKLGMNGTPIMTMTFDIREYAVEAEEKVTTPAGTFRLFPHLLSDEFQNAVGEYYGKGSSVVCQRRWRREVRNLRQKREPRLLDGVTSVYEINALRGCEVARLRRKVAELRGCEVARLRGCGVTTFLVTSQPRNFVTS